MRKYASEEYRDIAKQYGELLDHVIEKRIYRVQYNTSEDLCMLSDHLGFLKAGPRDVIEIHTGVLEEKCRGATQAPKHRLILKRAGSYYSNWMGDVVMFYRNRCSDNREAPLKQNNATGAGKRMQEVKNSEKSIRVLNCISPGTPLLQSGPSLIFARICDREFMDVCNIVIIDVLEYPQLAEDEKILAHPNPDQRVASAVQAHCGRLV